MVLFFPFVFHSVRTSFVQTFRQFARPLVRLYERSFFRSTIVCSSICPQRPSDFKYFQTSGNAVASCYRLPGIREDDVRLEIRSQDLLRDDDDSAAVAARLQLSIKEAILFRHPFICPFDRCQSTVATAPFRCGTDGRIKGADLSADARSTPYWLRWYNVVLSSVDT